MDGLECSEVSLNNISIDNSIKRIDSEFFKKKRMAVETLVKKHPCFYLTNDMIVSGPFGSTLKSDSYLAFGDIPFVRIENIRGGFTIDTSQIKYISSYDNQRIWNSQMEIDDLVLSKVGNTIGYFARVSEKIGKCNISENNIGIKLKGLNVSKKHYILTYLNSRFAQTLVLGRISGNAQPKLNVTDLLYIPIPAFSNAFYEKISRLIIDSETKLNESESIYKLSEQTLLSDLGMADFTIPEQSFAVKSFSGSFGASGRLDAEYYQEKYDYLFENLSAAKTFELSNLVWIKKSVEPGSNEYLSEGIPFVRVSDLSQYGLSEPEIYLNRIPFAHMNLQPKKDTILLSKDGSVGIAYKVDKDLDIVTSSAILHLELKTNQFLPDYLTLVLNSLIVKMQAERDAGGSVIQHWKPSEIEKVVIPWLPIDRQEKISQKIQESFSLRKESKVLLEKAKHAVEMAVEKDEQTALEWLGKQKQITSSLF